MKNSFERSVLLVGLGLGSPLLLGVVSCSDTDDGIAASGAGRTGSTGSGGSSHGGSAGRSGSSGGSSGDAGNQDVSGSGGQVEMVAGRGGAGKSAGGSGGKGGSSTSNAGRSSGHGGSTSTGGAGGEAGEMAESGAGGEAGSSAGAENDAGGAGAGGAPDDLQPIALCIFHAPPAMPVVDDDGGVPAPNGVAVVNNAFVGPYLTDLAGLALYIYGADYPGDCNTPPVSNCYDDCAVSWPIFNAGERTLPSTLDDSVFGTIQRTDGTFQTTYYGWPLYRYKSDTTANTINGQGKAKTWFAAEVSLPNLMIMRGPTSGGGIKYLSDDRGLTLYSLSGDTLGGSGTEPVSACTGTCKDAFVPYAPGAVYPVTTIEPHDVALFFRSDGKLQTAYKGAPLYYAKGDLHSGEQNGLTLFGGALVLP